MVATTTAAVRGGRSSPAAMSLWHLAGLLLGSTVLALALAGIGALLPLPRRELVIAVGGAASLAGLATLASRPLPVVSSAAQVPEAWRHTLSPAQYAFAYGTGLGLGVFTRIPSWSYHLLLALIVALGDPVLAILAAPTYALARGVPVILAAGSGRPGQAVIEAMAGWRGAAFRLDAALTLVVGVGLIVVAS
jgi:cytochrome c biogenesis protein CcdA